MASRFVPLSVTFVTAFLWSALHAQSPASVPPPPVDFVRDIKPIFQTQCYECHGAKKSKNGLRLDLRTAAFTGGDGGPAIVPRNSEHSLVIRRLLGLDGDERMPKDKDPLPPAQIAAIRAWIDQGAVWPESADAPATAVDVEAQHWAYRPPRRPPLPDVSHSSWVRNPVDRFVLARLEKEDLAPSPEAPIETLVRRVFLDLVGVPPSPQELDQVVADAARGGKDAAYARLVDRLLASPHYGERWARPWLDLARYADSQGFEKDNPRVMWKYRDWVIDALNRDMPFDRFTVEQIAGDMLPDATTDQLIASGFNRNAMTNEEGGVDPEESLYEVLVDRVNTTATVWLGSTLGCAQCHDHKYDPFTQRDYYRMMAFFANSAYDARSFGDGTRYFEAQIDVPTPEQETERKAIQTQIDDVDRQLKAATPELAAAQIEWEHAQLGEVSGAWQTLRPVTVSATGGVVLNAAPDGSVLASGANPGDTTYSIDAVAPQTRITAIRLEALPDPALPKNGPGRDVYGNFQLSGLEVLAGDPSAPVKLKAIAADDAAGAVTFDRGWRIDASRDDKRLPRQAVVTFAEPIDGGAPLRIRLKHLSSAVGQAIGRFRLSVTSDPAPDRIVKVPARLRPILAIADEDRTEKQRTDLAAFYRTIAPSLKPLRERRASLEKSLKALAIPSALVMRDKVSFERPSTYVRRRGNFMDKREKVYAGVPEVLPSLGDDQMPNRLGLARWLVDDRNPLTARVAVNRAWEQFFGRGLVETSEDFGTRGTPPSHPELLDWLATELVRQKWSMKALHKTIVMSATYRQSSAVAPELSQRDPYNRLLARGPRVRLDAEAIRDAVLAASGLLSETVGGPSVFPPQPDGIWDIPYSDDKWIASAGPDRYRRGLYVFLRRSAPYPSFLTFDATSRERCTVRRVRTNTPLQALTALNDEAFFEAARALAARVLRGATDVESRITLAFRFALSRVPTAAERERILRSYEQQLNRFRGDRTAAVSVLGSYAINGVDPAEQAAWTLVANALLNLDETVTKE